jgi:hypothetical protein
MSKKSFFFVIFSIIYVGSLQGQDLIKDTRNGVKSHARNIKPGKVAKWMEKDLSHIQASVPFDLFDISKNDHARNNLIKKEVEDPVFIDLKQEQLLRLNESRYTHLSLKVPVTKRNHFELYLKQVEFSNGSYVLNTSEGVKGVFEQTPGLFYRGYIKGNPNSWVALSVFEDYVRGIIADDNGNYIVGKMKGQEGYVIYNDHLMNIADDFSCELDKFQEAQSAHGVKVVTDGTPVEATAGECMPVYIETDYYTYSVTHGSNLTGVQNYITALFNETSTLYMNAGVKISLSEIFVHTTSGPYAGLNSTSALWRKFSELKHKNGFNGAIAEFITTKSTGGGVAWLDALCVKSTFVYQGQTYYYGPYGCSGSLNSSFPTVPTYSWDVEVFAHEMGHNWSSPHTHDCGWGTVGNPRPGSGGGPIDCCGHNYGAQEQNCGGVCNIPDPAGGGTIMSYCHLRSVGINFNLGFNPVVAALMVQRYNSKTCSVTCPSTCPDNMTISNEVISGMKEASAMINTSGTVSVAASSDATISAPSVTLSAGFSCTGSSTLTVNTTGCSNNTLVGEEAERPVIPTVDPIGGGLLVSGETKNEPNLSISPNPFSQSSTIFYEIKEAGAVSLQVFDGRGSLVKTLIANQHQTIGSHQITFERERARAGLFYIILKTENATSTKKMIMID